MTRILLGTTEPIEAEFWLATDPPTGATGLSPTVVVWRQAGPKFWNGAGYSASPPGSPLAMTAVDATNLPGRYLYAFASGSGATEEKHFFTASANSTTVVNPVQVGEFDIGGSPGSIQLADNALAASKIAADAGTEIGTAVWAAATRTLTAGNGISVDLVDGAISELTMDLYALAMIKGEVQAGLFLQGYTLARAFALDNLDASSQAIVDGQTGLFQQIALLNNLSQADVETALTTQGASPLRLSYLDNLVQILVDAAAARTAVRGKVVKTGTDPLVYTFYEPDGVTVAFVLHKAADDSLREEA